MSTPKPAERAADLHKRTLSPAYGEQFTQMLMAVAGCGFAGGVAALWPMCGSRYREDGLLYIGRATDGWGPEWTCSRAADTKHAAQWADEARRASAGSVPVKWTKSWFWRFARRVLVDVMGQPSVAWTERLAWSNLFKVAPSRAGNPAALLKDAQLPHAAVLLGTEIAELEPGLVVVAAGWCDWVRPVVHGSGWAFTPFPGRFVEQVGTIAGRPVLITRHPQGVRIPDADKIAEVKAALATRE